MRVVNLPERKVRIRGSIKRGKNENLDCEGESEGNSQWNGTV